LEFARYTLIGGLATGGHYAVLLALVEGFGVPPSIAAAIGAACGALIAYAGNRRFTFPGNHRHRRALPRFLIVAALGAALNGGIVWAGTNILAWHYLVAQIAATLLVLVITYTYNRSWTFA
jgi:putative flippase GtrA